MLKEIFLFEVRYHLRQPLFYICLALFFLLTFGAITSDEVTIGDAIGNVNRNAPYVIMQILLVMSAIGVFTTTAMVANSIYRDVEYNTQSLFFSTPIRKSHYLLGRFGGSLTISFMIFIGVVLGIIMGSFMPWLDKTRIAPLEWTPYVFSLAILVLPNLFLTGAIFFSLAAMTRSLLYTYVGVVVFFVGYAISRTLIRDVQDKALAAIVDPFGFGAFNLVTRYWTVFEKNHSVLPLGHVLIMNRLLWGGIGLIALVFTYYRFRFTASAARSRKQKMELPEEAVEMPVISSVVAPAVQAFSPGTSFGQYLHQTKVETAVILRSIPFVIMLFFGMFNIYGNSTGIDRLFGTSIYPVTHLMITTIESAFVLFVFLILTFYSGEVVWRERSLNLNGVYDALPVRNSVFWASKLTALVAALLILFAAGMLTTMGIQAVKGYYHFESALYGKGLFLNWGIRFLLIAVLGLFVQVITNHKFTGFLFMILYFVQEPILHAFGLEHYLYIYGSSPDAPYSDMNGYGHFVQPLFWFLLYWSFIAAILMVVVHLFWIRGTETSFRWRMALARQRLTLSTKFTLALLAVCAILSGGYIFYNTNILNKYTTRESREQQRAEYEKKYKKLEKLTQPRITDVQADVDIVPEKRSVTIHGTYTLKNKSSEPIHRLYFSLNPNVKIAEYKLPGATLESNDEKNGVRSYKLAKPMQPQETLIFEYRLHQENKGFVNSAPNTHLVYNGTFFDSIQYFPHVGYLLENQLIDGNKRKKYGLPPVERMPKITDEKARMNHELGQEADWVNFETTVSTSPDQIAIAPGYLQREWTQNGRRYFHYKMDAPILNLWAYLSAKWVVKKDHWNDVAIEVYYDPAHPYNVERMIEAVKKSLDYFTQNFSPFQHKQVRILEFPRYEQFAESLPNTIPFSESIGFIARIKDQDDIDYVYYVTAHEIAHQWWAHQVIGADVQGASVLTESLSQYSALMVMEKKYGPQQMRKFLKYELEFYLHGRGAELVEELPLMLVENQPYIHYRKGSLVFYALKDYIGEKNLNAALARFIKDKAYQEPPYTTTRELLDYIRQVTPPQYQYVLKDMLETITLYEDKIVSATETKTKDGRYRVKLETDSKKFRSDGMGKETEIPVSDYMDVAVFGKKLSDGSDKVLALQKMKIDRSKNQFEFTVAEKPEKAGIDPYNKLIDRNPEDNTKPVTQ